MRRAAWIRPIRGMGATLLVLLAFVCSWLVAVGMGGKAPSQAEPLLVLAGLLGAAAFTVASARIASGGVGKAYRSRIVQHSCLSVAALFGAAIVYPVMQGARICPENLLRIRIVSVEPCRGDL